MRYGLRTLLFVTAVIAVVAAWPSILRRHRLTQLGTHSNRIIPFNSKEFDEVEELFNKLTDRGNEERSMENLYVWKPKSDSSSLIFFRINVWSWHLNVTCFDSDGRIANRHLLNIRDNSFFRDDVSVHSDEDFICIDFRRGIERQLDPRKYIGRCICAFHDGQVRLIRIENEKGQNAGMTGAAGFSIDEEAVPFDFSDWMRRLHSNERLTCLSALNELPNECSVPLINAELQARLRELQNSTDVWISEAADTFESRLLKQNTE